ncbi:MULTISPECIES: HAD-IC family P-type ATPase [unclassified Rhodococcus (in: high G+C Gram-positive bacteria)]|uniref:HAD-IC family P-type ATPase n=2 Tax=Rhodococcus TaxID=1827 RepID=UPI000B9ACC2A|nr:MULTISPECIES: HAD-IC family P-type ATPase [unclassified Rhodococcus (in: high G+C Gram-positive bacteria)]OZE32330.1 magnesium-transporting ATPase [Rhodococcus sp. 05-2254-6]OZE37356.1 magnesium-transporting ATPase [Rhodococcus sp. 05-2254-4]OZE40490.1 magnesium-transporting ATPase [Rhodococcus sp. 05-2254-3]OZE45481.1 magnesium-transporting ATPase [Rhodococcus sp. 05-2254-2]
MSIEADAQRDTGLTEADVARLRAEGKSNDVPARASRSVRDIVRGNVFTRINAILGVLLIIVLSTGSVIDGMFGLLIVANSGIGIVQEIRAKRTLDRLAIVGQNKPQVRREGVSKQIPPDEVVLGDIVELGPGDQIVVDGEVIESASLEVDESLLTGEADTVHKLEATQVLSGSFVVAGSGAYRATKVGRDAYAAKLAEEASKFTLVKSELRSGIDKILKFITYLMIPAGALIIYNQLFSSGQALKPALNGMVAALVPMVPEGLVLMTSIAFAVGVIRLGQRQCLVQELPAIEGLARVDVVCADKTGTLTENGMRLSELMLMDEHDSDSVTAALASLAHDDPRPNASVQAVGEAYPDAPGWTQSAVAPFSSAKKWSGLSYGDHGNWLLGAPDVLLDASSDIARRAEETGSRGLRVLLLASSDRSVDDDEAPGVVTPRALVILEQKVREDARDTLEYFASQHVEVKVISGDNAVSVGAVAGSLGLPGGDAPIDARDLPEDSEKLADAVASSTTFGRVRPDQKRAMVGALQSRGHTVAMTGDGVNDVLALKDADIGVSMGSGSAATRAVAQIVLLDNKFATLPYVVGEGRRVIGNIERVSNLFLTKTVYSVLLAFLIGLSGVLSQIFHFEPIPYPFLPRHVTIAAWFTIGIPAFVLSLAPNNERARSGFVSRVMRLAVPSGLIVGSCTFVSYLLVYAGPNASETQVTQASTTALITLIMIALWVLAVVARPYNWWKILLLGGSVGGYLLLFAIPFCRTFFKLDPSNVGATTSALIIGGIGIALVEVAHRFGSVLRNRQNET